MPITKPAAYSAAHEVLVIDDEPRLRQLIARTLELEGYTVYQAPDAASAYKILAGHPHILLVLTDVKLPDANGLDVLKTIKTNYPDTEVVVTTAYGTIPDGVQAMKLGAFDYLTKGDQDDKLPVTCERALERAQMRRKIKQLESRNPAGLHTFETLTGKAPALLNAIALARKVATTDTVVLLQGETGTGKELFAQAIHSASLRNNKPFVAVNCSAFPDNLLESELFGHRKGAFTGAFSDKKGLFEEAEGGTLFLDEVGELGSEVQAKLLRVLETGSYYRLGDSKPVQGNVRIIAATNRDLLIESGQGRFRPDLFYRLSVFTVSVPPLRERSGDIELIARQYAALFALKTKQQVPEIPDAFMAALKAYRWPGNVRELKNALERAVILAEDGRLNVSSLPFALHRSEEEPAGDNSLEAVEKAHIKAVLAATGGNKAEAARQLQIGISTLYRKTEEYGLT